MTEEARLWGGPRGQDPDQTSLALNGKKIPPPLRKEQRR